MPEHDTPRFLEWLGLTPDGPIWREVRPQDGVPPDVVLPTPAADPACPLCDDTAVVVATDGPRLYVTKCTHVLATMDFLLQAFRLRLAARAAVGGGSAP